MRDTEKVTVIRYSDSIDEYGQLRTISDESFDIEMLIRRHSDDFTGDIRFNAIEYTCITDCYDLRYEDEIEWKGNIYSVQSIIPSKRHNCIIMKLKCK